MKLLIFTQKVDSEDSVLGFFHTWIREISSRVESVEVICLEKGQENKQLDLPKNVIVYSLGKSQHQSEARYGARKIFTKIKYVINLYHYLFLICGSYDRIFVHMNHEYVLLAGLYWKIKNIPVYLWRNHPRGSMATRIAVFLSTKVFATSTESFTARFKKTIIMPVGIDTNIFKTLEGIVRKKYSVLMLGRISPVKHIELAIETIRYLVSSGVQVSLSIVGSPPPRDIEYYNNLRQTVTDNNLSTNITFEDEVTKEKAPEIFSSHEICLNLTESGSFDKTIVEATACGAIPLVSNKSLIGLLPKVCVTENNPEAIAHSLERLLDPHEQMEIQQKLKSFAESQSLSVLMDKLFIELAE